MGGPHPKDLSQPLHYDGAGGELSDQNRPPVDGVANLNLPTKLLEVRSNFAPYYIFATLSGTRTLLPQSSIVTQSLLMVEAQEVEGSRSARGWSLCDDR
jgi:hypothetical protein